MFRLKSILVTSLTLCVLGAAKIPFFGDEKVPPLPAARSNPAKYRLPGGTTPTNYMVILKVDPNKQESFEGKVEINIIADLIDSKIVLHSNVLKITKISIMTEKGTDIYGSHTLSGKDTYFLMITLKEDLVVNGKYKIIIDYFGKFGTNLDGLYLSSYMQRNGTIRYLATTQFQPVHARDAFPCYDEPGLKAVFQINIYVPTGYHAICNTDRTIDTSLPPQENGLTLYAFDPSVKMSSYLVAFVISDFMFLSNKDAGQQKIFPKLYRVFAPSDLIDYVKYALEYGQKNIMALEKYTDVKYALDKLDNIAIQDFSAGAMENWGLITYKEPHLLNIPGVTKTEELQILVTVMAHENAHMWFGNEVSPEWWDYLWLSEGFATYFEYYSTNLVAPEWRMMEQYIGGCVFRAMAVDSLPSTNAMTSSVSSPEEIKNNFNSIAYLKSGSVVRMMEHVLGKKNFRKGLRVYLKSNRKGLGTPDKLFAGLQNAITNDNVLPAGKTVKDVFGLWSETPGFPLVYAKRSVRDGSITLRQERYYQDKSLSSDEKWYIPITWAETHNFDFRNTTAQEWLLPETTELVIKMNLRDNAWYILNKQVAGYYRIMYDDKNWERLAAALQSKNFTNIHLLNRVQLIEDSLEFAKNLRMSYNTTLNLLYYLKEEVDYIPWFSAAPGIMFLNTMFPAAENYNLFREYVRQIVKKAYTEVGFEENDGDKPDVKMNRIILLTIACTFAIKECREKSTNEFENYLTNTINDEPMDLYLQFIYCSAMRDANDRLWNSYRAKYTESSSDLEKTLILWILACSEDDSILKEYLRHAVQKDSPYPEAHRRLIIESVSTSGYKGVEHVVELVTKSFTTIKKVMEESHRVSIINTLGSVIVTKKNAKDFEDFAMNYGGFSAAEKIAVNLAVITIKQNREWLEAVLYDVDPWLLENVKSSVNSVMANSVILVIVSLVISFY